MDPTTLSLEALIERENLGLPTLHPGGLAMTEALARRCEVGDRCEVLDVGAGTGQALGVGRAPAVDGVGAHLPKRHTGYGLLVGRKPG